MKWIDFSERKPPRYNEEGKLRQVVAIVKEYKDSLQSFAATIVQDGGWFRSNNGYGFTVSCTPVKWLDESE
jgi:hypothetical protein